MHDPTCEGNDFFKCDYCHQSWADDRPMIEGHKGSLLCTKCLTMACVDVSEPAASYRCVMCIREGLDLQCWQSPMYDGVFLCRDCIQQAVRVFGKDPDVDWNVPAGSQF